MKRTVTVIILSFSLFMLACQDIGPGSFAKYTRNEAGVKRIKAYVQDKAAPVDARVEAVLALIEGGWYDEIRSVLQGAPDSGEVADKVCRGIVPRLREAGEDQEKITILRESLFAAMAFVPESGLDAIQAETAAWAFGDLTLSSSEEDVRKYVEPRIAITDIERLGAAGTKGAAILARHGFGTDKMADYIIKSGTPESRLLLLQALRQLHATPDMVIPFSQLEAVGKIKDPAAAEYLLDMAVDPNRPSDIRAAAFNEAAGLMEDPKVVSGDKTGILERLDKLGNSGDPDDRWSAVNFMVVLEGDAAVPKVMKYLKDDGVYPRATEDVMKTMVDFCNFVVFKKGRNFDGKAFATRLLESSSKVHRTLGVICAKASRDPKMADHLKPFQSSKDSVKEVLGEELTLGTIALNAVEGLGMFEEVSTDLKAGKLTEKDADDMNFFIMIDIMSTGKDYRKSVAERFRDEVASRSR